MVEMRQRKRSREEMKLGKEGRDEHWQGAVAVMRSCFRCISFGAAMLSSTMLPSLAVAAVMVALYKLVLVECLEIWEFLALPRADAIHLLVQYNGNAETVIQQIFA